MARLKFPIITTNHDNNFKHLLYNVFLLTSLSVLSCMLVYSTLLRCTLSKYDKQHGWHFSRYGNVFCVVNARPLSVCQYEVPYVHQCNQPALSLYKCVHWRTYMVAFSRLAYTQYDHTIRQCRPKIHFLLTDRKFIWPYVLTYLLYFVQSPPKNKRLS